jgi:hypothetical protein
MEARLFPPARYEDNRVAVGCGFVFKMSVNNRDAYSHLQDLISIRYTEKHHALLHYMATDKDFSRMSNGEKLRAVAARASVEDFTRRYGLLEYLPSDLLQSESVRCAEKKLWENLQIKKIIRTFAKIKSQ